MLRLAAPYPIPSPQTAVSGNEHLLLIVDEHLRVTFTVDWLIIAVAAAAGVAIAWARYGGLPAMWHRFEVDEAQLGLGESKITLRPNDVDRQIAYKIWVELSTRKVGLEIDLEHDVLAEVYDSWYSFFTVTRELIKDVPVAKFKRRDTEKIIGLSIDVLNIGLRPHLTKWQARFRHWYERQLSKPENEDLEPQALQMKFPAIRALGDDLKDVNARLISYRAKMYELVTGR